MFIFLTQYMFDSRVVDVVVLVPHRLVTHLLALQLVVVLLLHSFTVLLRHVLLDLCRRLARDDVVTRHSLLDDILRPYVPVHLLALVITLKLLPSLRLFIIMRDRIVP